MPSFKYTAYDTRGKKKEGIIESQTKNSAIAILRNKGIYTYEINGIAHKKSLPFFETVFSIYKNRISQKNRADMFFELSTLVGADIPLTEALNITADQSQNAVIRDALRDVKDKVNEGEKLSNAFCRHKNVFTNTYIKMIELAEKTGELADILFKIAIREEEKSSFNQKIMPVILYPAFILTLGMGIVSFLLVYVVPKMEKIFASFHKELPLITRALIALGVFLKSYFLTIILLSVVIVFVLRMLYAKNPFFKIRIDRFLLNIPLYRRVTIAQFTSALSFQLSAGILLVEAVRSSSYVVKNVVFREIVDGMAEKISSGLSIDTVFKESKLFDPMFIASLSMGKETGRLDDFVQRMSVFYDRKLSALLKTTVSLIEPAAILLLGLVVGFIVMAIMVPLFDINQLVK